MYHICIKCMFWMIRISPKPFENSGLLKEKKISNLCFFLHLIMISTFNMLQKKLEVRKSNKQKKRDM